MVTASGDEQKIKALEAGADDFLTKPIDQSELLARVRLAGPDQAVPGHHQASGRRARGLEPASWSRGSTTQVAQLERMGRLRRFLSPQLAELIVDSGDESFLESHRREIVVVFCDLRGFTTFAESSEPEEVMGVLKEYHEALGDLIFRFEGTLERFAGDGLMVFFNDPIRCDDGPLRAVRMSRRDAHSRAWPGRGLGAPGARPGVGHRDRPGLRDPGQDRLRRTASTTRRSAASPTSRPGCAQTREPWQILVTERVYAAAGSSSSARTSAARELRGLQPERPRLQRQGRRQLADSLMTGDLWTAPASAPEVLSALSETERYARFDVLQARMAGVWEAMRLNHDDESVVVIPSITLDRAVAVERQPDPGVRGAVPVPARAAAPAAAAHGLRDLDADRAGDHRVLPGAAAGSHPEPCPGTAVAGLGERLVPAAR